MPENAECPAVRGRRGGRQKSRGVRPQAADVPAELDVDVEDVDDGFESDDAEVEPDDEEPDGFVAGLLLDVEPRESLR
ncbi:hypothetical protein GCM10023100_45350 [Actinocorallia cavernae]|uniref:Uncharacterized protein n=1 Tax=Actinocorallia cavernae TaxID=328075 RepID=A0ABP8SVX1_9ACTN